MLSYLALIPSLDAFLGGRPRRGVLHWTAGTGLANSSDRSHYHFVFQADGTLVLGDQPVSANMRSLRKGDRYAAHVGGFNSFSVGFSFAGMHDAVPGRHGKHPLNEMQVKRGLRFVGLAFLKWGMDPLDHNQLFTHAETESLHGVNQNNKWDITELSFNPQLKPNAVGDWLRAETRHQIDEVFRGAAPTLRTVRSQVELLRTVPRLKAVPLREDRELEEPKAGDLIV